MQKLRQYLSLIKFSHTIFALPFALIGYSLAIKDVDIFSNTSKFKLFFLVVLCMIFARSAAMAFNRYIDRKIDAKNPRTASREIPAGIIPEQKALYFVIINCVLFIATTFCINSICFYLSPIALFTILFYSYTKRFTSLCHFVLGIGLSLAPIGAYLAVTGVFSLLPILFSFTVFTWVAGFDIMYALQDEEFDKSEKLFSIPSQLGISNALKLSTVIHFITAVLIVSIGFYSNFHISYWIGATIFIGLLIYQHLIVKPNDLSRINLAFGTTNGIASLVFALFTILSIYYSK
ncbi:MAG: putative 4-hydroxybenzoate polyprenyltransferase [Bacteroidota bacterium]|nr:putative 4-hydroxybenzoate polyprenyltransferase [Bacteroidota bacterium]